MKLTFVFIISFFLAQSTWAQISNDGSLLVRNRGGLSGYIQTYEPDARVEGDFLYFKEYGPVTLYLKDGTGTYKMERANVDLMNQAVLVDIKDNMYSINYARIDSALFEGLKVMDYQVKSSSIAESQMALILDESGTTTLYKTVEVQVIKPNYNEALDTGSRNFTLKHKVKYYMDFEGQGILDLSKKLKSFKGTSYYDQVKKFVKQNVTNFSSDKDVIKLNQFIATLN